MQADPSTPKSSLRGLLSSPGATAALASQRPVTALEFQLQLSRNMNPGRHGLPHRVHGARRALGRALRILDPKGDAPADGPIALLRRRHENLDYLENLLRAVSETPARKNPLEYRRQGPRHFSREAWLVASEGLTPNAEAQAVTWDGFPYYRYTPWRNPVYVPHVHGAIDTGRCDDCDTNLSRGEADWDPAIWFREVFRTEAGWIVEDSLRCGSCGDVVETREPRVYDGEVHPFLRR